MSTLEISQLLGNYGEFVGAVAIVVTLVYLAVQVRQGNQATNAASRDAAVAHVLGFFEQGMDNRVIARARHKLSSGAELDDFEREQLGRYQYYNFKIFDNIHTQYKQVRGRP